MNPLRWVVCVCLLAGCATWIAPLQAQEHRTQAESRDMRQLGHTDLQGRSGYHPVINLQNGRWIAYVGHHGGTALNPLTGVVEENGTSVVDVTDPRNPKYLAHIPGEEGEGEAGGAQMVRACNGRDLPKSDKSKTYLLRTFGLSAQEIWDVTAPERPVILTTVERNLKHTHKNWWECDTGIAYLVSGVKDWRIRRIMQVWDLSDPAKPVHIRGFSLPSHQPGSRGGRFGAHASNENQPPMYAKRILFFSWFNAGVRAVDIRDPYRPREIGYYIPAVTGKTDQRCVKTAEGLRCKVEIQTNNVEADDRGFIYIVDRANTGMHVLERTGAARGVADFK